MEKLTVNVPVFKRWVETKGVNAKERLALRAKISTRTVYRILEGYVPVRETTRLRVAHAMQRSVHTLFPKKRAAA